jgi:hypothetical protein
LIEAVVKLTTDSIAALAELGREFSELARYLRELVRTEQE